MANQSAHQRNPKTMNATIYTRSWAVVNASENKAGERIVSGYAARYNVNANLGNFNERIQPGAFDEADFSDVRFLVNHEGIPLARTTNGSLQLRITKQGLFYTATLPDTPQAFEIYEAVKDGRITSSSFAFTIAEEEWTPWAKLRTITKVGAVLDVSPTTFPAYLETSAVVGREPSVFGELMHDSDRG